MAVFSVLEPVVVPSGSYELAWRQSEHGAAETVLMEVGILPDQLNVVEVATGINPVPADWVPPRPCYWGLLEPKTRKFAAQYRDAFAPQLVPPGRYRFIYRQSEHGSSDSDLGEIEVAPASLNEFKLDTGMRLIPQPESKPPYKVEFVQVDPAGKESPGARLSESFGPMPLAPGRYRIRFQQDQHGTAPMIIVDAADLASGNLVEIEL